VSGGVAAAEALVHLYGTAIVPFSTNEFGVFN